MDGTELSTSLLLLPFSAPVTTSVWFTRQPTATTIFNWRLVKRFAIIHAKRIHSSDAYRQQLCFQLLFPSCRFHRPDKTRQDRSTSGQMLQNEGLEQPAYPRGNRQLCFSNPTSNSPNLCCLQIPVPNGPHSDQSDTGCDESRINAVNECAVKGVAFSSLRLALTPAESADEPTHPVDKDQSEECRKPVAALGCLHASLRDRPWCSGSVGRAGLRSSSLSK